MAYEMRGQHVNISDATGEVAKHLRRTQATRLNSLSNSIREWAHLPYVAKLQVLAAMATFRRSLIDLKQSMQQLDIERTRAVLAQLFGEIRFVPEGDEIYAEIPSAGSMVIAAGGGTMGPVAGTRNLN